MTEVLVVIVLVVMATPIVVLTIKAMKNASNKIDEIITEELDTPVS